MTTSGASTTTPSVDPDLERGIGRNYRDELRGEPRWLWFLRTVRRDPVHGNQEGRFFHSH